MRGSGHKLLDRRLLLFTGKGGVGKTSVVAGLAAELAARGRRPLVVELGHRASMEAVFGVEGINYRPREVGLGVSAMNLDFDHALQDYMDEHVPIKRVARAIMGNKALQRFFQAAPSVAEVATLNKISALEAERSGGKPRWDPVLVDLDATGHALMLLNLPGVMDGLIGDGPMRRLIDGFSSLLTDSARTTLSLVTLPKELPTQETCELYERLRGHHEVSLGALFINQVPVAPMGGSPTGAVETVARRARDRGARRSFDEIEVLRRAQSAHERAQAQIERLGREIDMPTVELPWWPAGVDASNVAEMGRSIFDGLSRVESGAVRR